MATRIENARIVTPTRVISPGWVLIHDRKIRSIGQGDVPEAEQVIDAQGLMLLPGFIDLHVHGAMGHDTMDASLNGLREMACFYAMNGVTGFLATTWTDSRERIFAAMQTVHAAIQRPSGGAKLLGVHMEGPYLNVDYCGAQNPDYIRRADPDEMAALFELDVIRLLALAPEFEENHRLIQECARLGIPVSVAHSGASYEQMTSAFHLGISHATHTYNAMTGLHHRKPGIVGAVLTTPHINAELIADTIHVHPAAMRLLWQTKGPDHLMLITDAIRAAGMPDGEYRVDDRTMIVKDGECRLPSGTLAGSIIAMNDAVRNFARAVEEPLERVWPATSLNAARAIHIAAHKGSIEIGKDADLILVDEGVNVYLTMVEGDIVYQRMDSYVASGT